MGFGDDLPRRVLVVDDDAINLKILTEALKLDGYTIQQASSGEHAIQQIEDYDPELVLMDYNMGKMTGLDTLKLLRARKNYVAVLFVSANSEGDVITQCLEAGADDFIRKPAHLSELRSRVKVRFRLKDLQDELMAANEKLAALAVTDDITGLFNMRSIYDRIENELRRAKRYDRQVSCVMMDIDHFKEVNDLNDHLFGTFVIRELGKLIKKNIRDVDFAARYGGDEFLIVLPETSEEGARTFTERLRQVIENYTFTDGKSQLKRTCSFGFAVSHPANPIDAKSLVREADHALYRAKEGGRNRISA
jgi:two-component system, cell cycle response regulator